MITRPIYVITPARDFPTVPTETGTIGLHIVNAYDPDGQQRQPFLGSEAQCHAYVQRRERGETHQQALVNLALHGAVEQ